MDASRRYFLWALGAAAGALTNASAASRPQGAERMQAAIRSVVGDSAVRPGKVKLDVPPLIDNGNAVPLSVTVESPMTQSDYVKAIHVFNEKNPQPGVMSVYLGPRAGLAHVSTRIRLADTQTVMAIAEMSDGSFWSGSASVIVTLAACLEELS